MTNNVNDILKGVVSTMTQPNSQQVYSQVLQLVLGSPISLDFKTLQNNLALESLQGVWIDNSAGTSPVTIASRATFQNFTVPAGYQGVAPLYITADLVLNISGAGTVPIVFLNFPTPVSVWPATGATSGSMTFTGPNLNTQDVNIAAALDQTGVGVVGKAYTGGDGIVRLRSGNVINASVTAAGNTVLKAGFPSVFISSIDISVDGNAAMAAAGVFTATLSFGTSAQNIVKRSIVLPAAAPATPTPRYELFNQSGLAFIGALAGDNITLNLSAALTAGAVQVTLGAGSTGVQ